MDSNSSGPPHLPRFLAEDPDHWRGRAKQMRATADTMEDEGTKSIMLRIAKEYEKLAKRSSQGNGDIDALSLLCASTG